MVDLSSPPVRWWRAALLVVLLVGMAVLVRAYGLPDQAEIQQQVAAAGSLGWLIFVAGYAVCALLPAPKGAATIIAGALFGLLGGVLLAWTGAMIGAVLSFVIARRLGRTTVERMLRGRLGALDTMIGERGFLAVLLLRLVPLFPFTAVNYGTGVTAVSLRSFVVGSAVGMIPGSVAYAALGAFGGSDPTGTALAVGALVVLSVGGWLVARRYQRPAPAALRTTEGEG